MFDILIRFSFFPIRKSSLLVRISYPVYLSPHPEMAHKMIHYLYQEINWYLCRGVACYCLRKILKYLVAFLCHPFGFYFMSYILVRARNRYIMFVWKVVVVVCTWRGLEICLFWNCIDVIALKVKAIRGIPPTWVLIVGTVERFYWERNAKCRHLKIFYL